MRHTRVDEIGSLSRISQGRNQSAEPEQDCPDSARKKYTQTSNLICATRRSRALIGFCFQFNQCRMESPKKRKSLRPNSLDECCLDGAAPKTRPREGFNIFAIVIVILWPGAASGANATGYSRALAYFCDDVIEMKQRNEKSSLLFTFFFL